MPVLWKVNVATHDSKITRHNKLDKDKGRSISKECDAQDDNPKLHVLLFFAYNKS